MSNIFTNFINGLKNFLGSVWHFLTDYIHAALPEAKAILLKDLLELADPIVADLNNQDMTGVQKRDQAIQLITGKASQAGLEIGMSLINLAIEMAVQRAKNAQATLPGNGGVLPGGILTPNVIPGGDQTTAPTV